MAVSLDCLVFDDDAFSDEVHKLQTGAQTDFGPGPPGSLSGGGDAPTPPSDVDETLKTIQDDIAHWTAIIHQSPKQSVPQDPRTQTSPSVPGNVGNDQLLQMRREIDDAQLQLDQVLAIDAHNAAPVHRVYGGDVQRPHGVYDAMPWGLDVEPGVPRVEHGRPVQGELLLQSDLGIPTVRHEHGNAPDRNIESDRFMRLAAARVRLETLHTAYASLQHLAQQSAASPAVAMSAIPTHAGVHRAPYPPHGVRWGHDALDEVHVDAEEAIQSNADAVGVHFASGPHTAIPIAHLAAPVPAVPAAPVPAVPAAPVPAVPAAPVPAVPAAPVPAVPAAPVPAVPAATAEAAANFCGCLSAAAAASYRRQRRRRRCRRCCCRRRNDSHKCFRRCCR